MFSKFKDKRSFKDSTINRISGINVIAFLLGIFIYAINGNSLSFISLPPEVIKIIIALISLYFLTDQRYIKPKIEEWVKEDVKEYADNLYKEVSDILIRQDLDFLYGLQPIFHSVKDLSYQNLTLDSDKETPISRSKIDNRVKEHGIDQEIREKAVEELLKAEQKKHLQGVAQLAAEEKLKVTENNKEKYETLVKAIHAYLRAWLIFSIKHHRNMPIDQIVGSTINVNDIRDHIKAIEFIREIVLEAETKEDLIPSQSSREIIQEYLDKLIEKLSEKLP